MGPRLSESFDPLAFDSARVDWRADTADVWVRYQYNEPQRSRNDSTETFNTMDVNLLVHCPSQHARNVRMLMRAATGDSIDGLTYPYASYAPFHQLPSQARLQGVCAVLPGVPQGG